MAGRYGRALAGVCRDWRKLPPAASGVLRLAFLVERHGWSDFQRRVEILRNAPGAEPCTLLGPWPPYSFVH